MNKAKRYFSVILALLLTLSAAVPAMASGEETGAQAAPSGKEEVIYFTLDASGAVDSAYAVNSFPGGEITDYGDYGNVRILNTEDEITLEGDEVHISSDAAKVYYQGEMKNPELPWDITLEYTLDGKSVSPEKLGGGSGELEIRFAVTKNEKCRGTFYEDYALQASFTLPGDCCTAVSAPDATIASVGADKQLTFTLLPGEGIDTVIKATVENFSMPAVSINGIHLNLNVDVDTDGIKGMVGELVSAAAQLDNGASALVSGSNALLDGTAGLQDGADSLQSGIAELDAGVAELQEGLSAMQAGLNELYARSPELTGGSAQVYAALNTINGELAAFDVNGEISAIVSSLTPQITALSTASAAVETAASNLKTALTGFTGQIVQAYFQINSAKSANTAASGVIDAMLEDSELAGKYDLNSVKAALEGSNSVFDSIVSTVSSALGTFNSYASALETALTELDTAGVGLASALEGLSGQTGALVEKVDALKAGVSALTSSYAALNSGIGSYTGGVAQLVNGFGSVMSGVAKLSSGSSELLSGSGELSSGTAQLYDGVAALCDGAQAMANGAGQLHSETSGVDIQAEVDGLLASIGGSMDSPESFTSEKNGVVSSVQFVIQTGAIEAPEAEPEPTPVQEEPTLWERFLALFGL